MACHLAKKKKSSAKSVKVSTSIPTLPSASTSSASTLVDSSVPNLEGDSVLLDFEQSDSGHCHSELELIALDVINKPEMEEGMATDLRADFKERHHKRLHEAIEVVACPAKRTCPKGV